MTTVLLLIHLFVTLALIGVVLIQRSEGGGLGIGSSQGMGSFMSGRGTANLLTRTTAVLGACFFALSLTLALISFLTVVAIPLTYSIANGLAFGITAHAILKLVGGRARRSDWLLYGLTVLFVARFIYLAKG